MGLRRVLGYRDFRGVYGQYTEYGVPGCFGEGIISKGCSAETSGKTDRTVNREDERQPPLLSAKRVRLTAGSSGQPAPLMTVPLLPLWGDGGRGGILSGYAALRHTSDSVPMVDMGLRRVLGYRDFRGVYGQYTEYGVPGCFGEGIISKGCSAETSGKTDRTVNREDERQPPLLSAKRVRLTAGSSGQPAPLMTVPLLPLWGDGGRGGILSGY
ncbi:hypothetical protein BaRGS_00020648, partial [Batillaria attramentaria]